MKSDHYCDISVLSKICGLINTMAQMRGATITDSLAIELECAAERLELYVSDLIEYSRAPCENEHLHEMQDERPMKKVVKVYEKSEESPPEPQQTD